MSSCKPNASRLGCFLSFHRPSSFLDGAFSLTGRLDTGGVDGVCRFGWLIFLTPLANHLSTYLKVLGVLAELSLMLWLIVNGVNVQQWKEQAGPAVE
jgi:hypothetical protein